MPPRLTGVESTIKAFGKAKVADAINISDGLTKCAEVILRKALLYCPVDKGDLRLTGRTEVEGKGLGAEAGVSFGGTSPTGRDVNYAWVVHDDMTKTHAPPTCARFLTRAARETRGTCTSILRRNMSVSESKGVSGGGEQSG